MSLSQLWHIIAILADTKVFSTQPFFMRIKKKLCEKNAYKKRKGKRSYKTEMP